ncbi:MAG: lipoyl(octanoyl) transferase LipB [Prevotella sp.]|nr:lipoyl(octanoyl) transferase LipB [Bacteroides sp.]MCM1366744.1 lipoyl(octanoyl) transferase LipB [Prevotella sp.]MCM1437018.1 lipoyl(octanoyl) transferase LipB [Prevotella sp.]
MSINISFEGVCDYRPMWEKQLRLFNNLIYETQQGVENPNEHILLVEHNHVYTLGKHGHPENMLADEKRLSQYGAECIKIERGGDITYHGPGQLVVYPIISLRKHSLGVKNYVTLLEEAVILFLARYGIVGQRIDGATGVWIDKGTSKERKICAIGVKCRKFVTMHGLALNINTNLNYFSLINPCGFVDKGVTSIAQEIGHEIDFKVAAEEFGNLLASMLR